MNREELLKIAKPILFNTDMVRATQDERKTVTRRVIKPANPFRNKEGYCQGNGLWIDGYSKNDEPNGHIKDYSVSSCWLPKKHYIDKYAPYKKGSILYVRETWSFEPCWDCGMDTEEHNCCDESAKKFFNHDTGEYGCYIYRASFEDNVYPSAGVWYPSIHMPKEAARIFLKVTDVRVERLQDITEKQAIREGIMRLFDNVPDAEYIDWTKRVGFFPKDKEDWDYKNYLWHGNFGVYGSGNKMSDSWEYQRSSYNSARDSFSSLWNVTVPLKEWGIYGWDVNPWVWVIEFERMYPESEGL